MRLHLAPLFALGFTPAFAFQTVHVVNGGTGNALQAVVDAAANGDTILVHGGSFGAVHVFGKALTLIAEPAHGTSLARLQISGHAPNQRCIVAGFDIHPTELLAVGVSVNSTGGSVRLEDVHVFGGPDQSTAGLGLLNASDVACVRCVFAAGSQFPATSQSFPSVSGITCASSQLALYDCIVTGGAGQDDHVIDVAFHRSGSGTGGAALECLGSSTVFASGSSFTGGAGGQGLPYSWLCATLPCGAGPTTGGNGGHGVVAEAGSTAALLDCVVSGGAGGAGGAGGQCCPQTVWPAAAPGVPGSAEQGTITHFPGASTAMSAPSAVRVGNTLPLTIGGTPGDVIFLAVSSQSRFVFDPFYSGVFLFGPAARRSSFGVVPGSGVLNVSISVGTLPVGAQSAVRHLQVFARDPSGQLRLGSPAIVTVLDPSF